MNARDEVRRMALDAAAQSRRDAVKCRRIAFFCMFTACLNVVALAFTPYVLIHLACCVCCGWCAGRMMSHSQGFAELAELFDAVGQSPGFPTD